MQTQDEKKVLKGLSPSECTPHSEKSGSGVPKPSRAHALQHGLREGSHRGNREAADCPSREEQGSTRKRGELNMASHSKTQPSGKRQSL